MNFGKHVLWYSCSQILYIKGERFSPQANVNIEWHVAALNRHHMSTFTGERKIHCG